MNIPQNSDFMIVSNNEAASIICRFTPEMISDIVQEQLNNKFRSYSVILSNIIESIETNYKMAMAGIPEYNSEIMSQRYDIYRQIIEMVCNAHHISYIGSDNNDIYSDASMIYDFLVAKFNIYIVQFFVNYINREKSTLYEILELASKKKEVSVYSKKLYKNNSSKLAVIHTNLEFILSNICIFDIDFENFIETACKPDKFMGRYLLSILSDRGDFFTREVVPYFSKNYAELVTQTKFALQELSYTEFDDIV